MLSAALKSMYLLQALILAFFGGKLSLQACKVLFQTQQPLALPEARATEKRLRPGRIVSSLATIRPSNAMYSTQSWK